MTLALALAGCQSLPTDEKPWLPLPSEDNVTSPFSSRVNSAIAPPPGEEVFAGQGEVVVPEVEKPETMDEKLDRYSNERLFSFSAQDLDIKTALAMFAKSHELNIVPDADITGTLTVEFRNLSLSQSFAALLDSFGYYVEIDRDLIRVKSVLSEQFTVDYIRLVRSGVGASSANVSSGSGGETGGGQEQEIANIAITQQDSVAFWDELTEQLQPLLTDTGQLTVNRMAGKIMVTDRKPNVDRIGEFLAGVKTTLHRQVDIEARIYEVVLNDEFNLGIDWQNVNAMVEDYLISSGGAMTGIASSSTIIQNPFGGITPASPALNLSIQHDETSVVIQALRQQGNIEVVSQPRVRTMNNQSALIKVGVDKPFFRTSSTTLANAGASTVSEDVEVISITIGTILSITPQITQDGWVTMDISPIITRLIDTALGPNNTTAPEVDVKQTSSLVRVRNNSTVVIGGLIQNERYKTERKVPLLADIPLVGKLFTGRFDTTRKTELVIFITPTVVE